MDRWLSKYSEFLYAAMRLMVGLLFACHGVQKLFGMLGLTFVFLIGQAFFLGRYMKEPETTNSKEEP